MYSEIVFVVFCFKCKSADNLMNRKNIRFKLGIGAEKYTFQIGYRREVVGV